MPGGVSAERPDGRVLRLWPAWVCFCGSRRLAARRLHLVATVAASREQAQAGPLEGGARRRGAGSAAVPLRHASTHSHVFWTHRDMQRPNLSLST